MSKTVYFCLKEASFSAQRSVAFQALLVKRVKIDLVTKEKS
jgi:hypothetical protein